MQVGVDPVAAFSRLNTFKVFPDLNAMQECKSI